MVNAVVVSMSKTGFTQQFALWIARALHCELVDTKFLTAADLAPQAIVIYGGRVRGGEVAGFDRFYRQFVKTKAHSLVVFGTGTQALDAVARQALCARTFKRCPSAPPFFYLRGHTDPKTLPWLRQLYYKVRGVRSGDQCAVGKAAILPLLQTVATLDDHR